MKKAKSEQTTTPVPHTITDQLRDLAPQIARWIWMVGKDVLTLKEGHEVAVSYYDNGERALIGDIKTVGKDFMIVDTYPVCGEQPIEITLNLPITKRPGERPLMMWGNRDVKVRRLTEHELRQGGGYETRKEAYMVPSTMTLEKDTLVQLKYGKDAEKAQMDIGPFAAKCKEQGKTNVVLSVFYPEEHGLKSSKLELVWNAKAQSYTTKVDKVTARLHRIKPEEFDALADVKKKPAAKNTVAKKTVKKPTSNKKKNAPVKKAANKVVKKAAPVAKKKAVAKKTAVKKVAPKKVAKKTAPAARPSKKQPMTSPVFAAATGKALQLVKNGKKMFEVAKSA